MPLAVCLKQLMIQVDIGGHPPFPNGSKQFSSHFGNLLFLAGFHFWGHFEGLNEVFSSTIPFQRAITRLKRRLYAKVATPES
jgi:hypothetical protein